MTEKIGYLQKNKKQDSNPEKIIVKVLENQTSLKNLFKSCDWIKNISFRRSFTNKIIDIKYMMFSCSFLKEIYFDLNNYNIGNLQNMSFLFSSCKSLKKAILANFNSFNLINIRGMFSECICLEKVDFINFNTKNVSNMREMFYECSKLKYVSFSNFDTKNVTDMSYMFFNCKALKHLDISNFNIQNLDIQKNIFFGCCNELKNNIKEQKINFKKEAYGYENQLIPDFDILKKNI